MDGIQINNEQDYAVNFLRKLNKNRDKLCDVQLKVQDTLIPAHKIVLATGTEYFQNKFAGTVSFADSKDSVVQIENEFSIDSVKSIVDYLYSGMLNLSVANSMNLLETANYYGIQYIKEECFKILQSNITQDNCINIWCLFDLINFNMDKINLYITDNIVEVASNSNFLELNETFILRLFRSIFKCMEKKSAEQLYMAMIKWIKYDKNRQPISTKLIKLFPVKYLKIKSILSLIRQEKLIQENTELNKWLMNAMIDMIFLEPPSNSVFIMDKDARFYWIYNPITTEIQGKNTQFPAITGFSLTTINSKIFLTGGKLNTGKYSRICYIYDAEIDNWSTIPFPYAIRNYKSCHLNGKIYLVGRKNAAAVKELEMLSFDVNTQTITNFPNVQYEGSFDILVSGGFINLISYNYEKDEIKIEAFDIAKNIFTKSNKQKNTSNVSSSALRNMCATQSNNIIIVELYYIIYDGYDTIDDEFLQYKVKYDVIQNKFINPDWTNQKIRYLSDITSTNSAIYGVSDAGIHCLNYPDWKIIFNYDFSGASITPIEETSNVNSD